MSFDYFPNVSGPSQDDETQTIVPTQPNQTQVFTQYSDQQPAYSQIQSSPADDSNESESPRLATDSSSRDSPSTVYRHHNQSTSLATTDSDNETSSSHTSSVSNHNQNSQKKQAHSNQKFETRLVNMFNSGKPGDQLRATTYYLNSLN